MKDFFRLIKKRRTIRKYKCIYIPNKIIYKIVKAATWAPSPHNSQPWYFVIIKDDAAKKSFVKLLRDSSIKLLPSIKSLFNKTVNIIENTPVIILVYNTRSFSKRIIYLKEPYFSIANLSEIKGISAAVQNMYLMAYSIGVGMAWLDMPLLFKHEINRFVQTKYELIALLTIGYPAEKGFCFKRKPLHETMKYLD